MKKRSILGIINLVRAEDTIEKGVLAISKLASSKTARGARSVCKASNLPSSCHSHVVPTAGLYQLEAAGGTEKSPIARSQPGPVQRPRQAHLPFKVLQVPLEGSGSSKTEVHFCERAPTTARRYEYRECRVGHGPLRLWRRSCHLTLTLPRGRSPALTSRVHWRRECGRIDLQWQYV